MPEPELSDADFLRDLADRIWKIPVSFGTDGGDFDRLVLMSEQIRRQSESEQPPVEIPLFSSHQHDVFCQAFVIDFLASYAVSTYAVSCQYDPHDELHSFPVEDAEQLAESAWQNWVNAVGVGE